MRHSALIFLLGALISKSKCVALDTQRGTFRRSPTTVQAMPGPIIELFIDATQKAITNAEILAQRH